METLIWSLYIVLFLASLVCGIVILMARGYAAIDLPQMVYLLFVYVALVLGAASNAFPGWVVLLAIAAVPPAGLLMGRLQRHSDNRLECGMLSEELHRAERFLIEHPEDPFPLQQMAELYEKTGDDALAMACYEQIINSQVKEPAVQDKFRPRLKRLKTRLMTSGPEPQPRSGLRGCVTCGEIVPRSIALCPRCSSATASPGGNVWLQQGSILLTQDVVFSVATAGVIALPFRVYCGAEAFALLWGASGLAMWLWLSNSRREIL